MFKQIKKKILYILGYSLLNFLLGILCRTVKINIFNYGYLKNILENNKNAVVAFWHGSMLIPWFFFRDKNFVALVSQSKDGELLARLLKKWNYMLVRGSSSKGGKESLEELVDILQQQKSICITPDGPKGPPEKMKAGAVIASKKSGVPLIVVGTDYSNFFELKSWDSFKIPKPFSNATLVFSDPITINPDLNYDETSALISETENLLIKLTQEAKTAE